MMIGIVRGSSLTLYYQLATLCILILFALYDIRYHRVRNAALICFLPLLVQRYSTGLPDFFLLFRAFLGFLNGGLILFTTALVTHGGIGGGDIKLTALLGIICGSMGVCILLSAAALGALLFLLSLIHI